MSKNNSLKTGLLALGAFVTMSQEIAAQDNTPVVKDSLTVHRKCAGPKLVTSRLTYQDNGKISVLKHNTTFGAITYIDNAKETFLGSRSTGFKIKSKEDKATREKYNIKKNNVPEAVLNIKDAFITKPKESCKKNEALTLSKEDIIEAKKFFTNKRLKTNKL